METLGQSPSKPKLESRWSVPLGETFSDKLTDRLLIHFWPVFAILTMLGGV